MRGIREEGGEAMSMLSMQADELRKMADKLGVNGVCTGDLSKLYVMLREAAETIEGLSDELNATLGDDATAFAKRVEQAVANREPLTLFGVDYEAREECERVKRGTKPDGTPRYRCSVCDYGLGDYRWAFCPKCGCRIRGER